MRASVWALALAAIPVVASAKTTFSTYEGVDAIQEGRGGAKLTKNGVDWWTSGTPPRRFRVLGVIEDTRMDKLLSGNAIGSSGIARQVLAAGGDAVIVTNRNEKAVGFNGFRSFQSSENSAFEDVSGRTVHSRTTTLVVIKYLP